MIAFPTGRTWMSAALMALALLSLRWPLEVSLATFRGVGHVDRSILAFVATFLLMAAGLPGLAISIWKARVGTRPLRRFTALSLISLLIGCVGSLVWISVSIRMIGATLSPAQIMVSVVPPLLTAIGAVWLRVRLQRESSDKGLWRRSLKF